jgi:hypothetical protein
VIARLLRPLRLSSTEVLLNFSISSVLHMFWHQSLSVFPSRFLPGTFSRPTRFVLCLRDTEVFLLDGLTAIDSLSLSIGLVPGLLVVRIL